MWHSCSTCGSGRWGRGDAPPQAALHWTALAALAVDLVAARRCAEVRLDDAQRRALVGLAEDAAALGGVAQGGVGGAMIAGAPTVQRSVDIP